MMIMKLMNEKQLNIVSGNWRDIAMYDFLTAEVEKIAYARKR